MTLLESFGISSVTLRMPDLRPGLPQKSEAVQHPIAVSSGGTQPVIDQPPGSKVPQTGPIKQYARKLLRQYGWASQWDSFNKLELSEAGWNPKIANPNSGAYGLAQALSQNPDPSVQGQFSDNYQGQGLTNKQLKMANSGDPYWQLVWMMAYIKARYGSPDKAWAFHQANNWY